MFKNYFIIAFRNIKRNLSSTVINISGLSLGITGSIVLFLLISFLTSFDNFHTHGDRIYRLVHSRQNQERLNYGAGIPNPLPDMIAKEIQGIEHVLKISGSEEVLITVEEGGERKLFKEENMFAWTDSLYFTFFNQPVVQGSYKLINPNEVIISPDLARKFFGNENALGKRLLINNQYDLIVTGILEKPRDNTNFPFQILGSYETVRKVKLDEGMGSISSDDQCYIMLTEGASTLTFEEQLIKILTRVRDDDYVKYWNYWLQPLDNLHYDTRFSDFVQRSISKESIWAIGVVLVFLLTTACINFINLSTAIAMKRTKEIGVRKVLGSLRKQLIAQHLIETALITFFALIFSVGLAELILIRLNNFLDVNLHINLAQSRLLIFLLVVWIGVSLIAGLYPAFLVSRYSPIQVLKSSISSKSSIGFGLRRALVVFQFVISQILIIGTVVLLSQMDYFKKKDLGFTSQAVITFPVPEEQNIDKKRSLRDRISNLPGVEQVTLCYHPPSSGNVSISGFQLDDVEGDFLAQLKAGDESYVSLFDLQLLSGTTLVESDTIQGWIVNEKLVQSVGLTPEEILGRNLEMWDYDLPVKGVVKDFHTLSLEHNIDPVILYTDIKEYETLAVKVESGHVNSTLPLIEKIWEELYPDHIYTSNFFDDEIADFYESTEKMSFLLIVFSSMAIFIGCLGLYGLVSYMSNQKEKEIGIRKVLGASSTQILRMFSKEFVILILIGFAIAAPLAGYVMNQWLQNFQYHISLSWTMFFLAVMVTLLVSLLTVGYRSLKAAWSNPAEILRAE